MQEAFLTEAAPSYRRKAATVLKDALILAARDPAALQTIEAVIAGWHGTTGNPPSWTRLHDLLQRQSYRLAHWRTAADEVNYRRFFDIPELAGMRMERIVVFRDAHAFIGRLLADGILQGLRIDHVDGLADPQRYCRRLNAFAAAIVPRSADGRRLRPYILVEKILTGDERMPARWPISGTTGYDYLALANGLFIDPTGFAKLQRGWSRFTGMAIDIAEEIYRCRLLVIDRSLASELTYLVNWLVEIAEADWFTRDYTRKRLRDALTAIVAAFSVYRTYVTDRGSDDADRKVIATAVAKAHEGWDSADGEILDFIASLLTLDIRQRHPGHFADKRAAILRFIARFQQYTGAIAAKSVEDTFFYRHVPLASANEVGASPYRPATSIATFHDNMAERAAQWPLAMLASATHDTKRGEDMRVRLDVLSEMPDEWARRVARWQMHNKAHHGEVDGRPAPSANDEYLLYQSIVGTWPLQPGAVLRSTARRDQYVARLKAYAIKAAREAKLVTSWTAPNEPYEKAFETFIEKLFDPPHNAFTESLTRFLPPILRLGAFNSLTQLVLKATSPGVPDFYQGSEFWDLSLVDPDNRRPVDYGARREAIKALDFNTALTRWRDGWLKLWLTEKLLGLRASPAVTLFQSGQLRAADRRRPGAPSMCIAFQRRSGETQAKSGRACRRLACRPTCAAIWACFGRAARASATRGSRQAAPGSTTSRASALPAATVSTLRRC